MGLSPDDPRPIWYWESPSNLVGEICHRLEPCAAICLSCGSGNFASWMLLRRKPTAVFVLSPGHEQILYNRLVADVWTQMTNSGNSDLREPELINFYKKCGVAMPSVSVVTNPEGEEDTPTKKYKRKASTPKAGTPPVQGVKRPQADSQDVNADLDEDADQHTVANKKKARTKIENNDGSGDEPALEKKDSAAQSLDLREKLLEQVKALNTGAASSSKS